VTDADKDWRVFVAVALDVVNEKLTLLTCGDESREETAVAGRRIAPPDLPTYVIELSAAGGIREFVTWLLGWGLTRDDAMQLTNDLVAALRPPGAGE
jgi:hypothetical protein